VDINAFVKSIVALSQTIQQCADAALQNAHDQYDAGTITYAAYANALQQKIAVTQSCYTMTNAASSVLLSVAQTQMGPIQDATAKLEAAAGMLDKIKSGVVIVSELVVAAGAVAGAIGAPSPASIAAAGSALYTVASQIIKDASGGSKDGGGGS
jgi:hypothetical protein